MRLRVSCTEIDQYLYYRDNEDFPLADLLSRLRKESPPSEAMLAGIAFHKCLEMIAMGVQDVLESSEYRFIFVKDMQLPLPGFREIKAEKLYQISGHDVTLVGKVDDLHGLTVTDHKTTSRFDPERLMTGYQWRYYLDMFDGDKFIWNVFEIAPTVLPRTYMVKDFHELIQYRYPDLADDCDAVLAQFVEFAIAHLPERCAA